MKRSLGQNFLIDGNTIRKIVAAGGELHEQRVLEIGGGAGALTGALLDVGARVTVIETDPEWVQVLRDEFDERAGFRVVHADAKKVDFASLVSGASVDLDVPDDTPSDTRTSADPVEAAEASADPAPRDSQAPQDNVVVYGNLPYNQAIHILMHLVRSFEGWSRMILMFQREVANRIVAPHGSRTYGVLPIKLAPLVRSEKLFDIPPTCFRPKPKVVSSVVRFEPLDAPLLPPRALLVHYRVTQAAFNYRRKTLINALGRGEPSAVPAAREALTRAGLSEMTRPEQLPPAFYMALAQTLAGT
jgi:16S rRNA (adenine1518-N6/adenine1519-N6)-dimethyltransferase